MTHDRHAPREGAAVLPGGPAEGMLIELRGVDDLSTQDMTLNVGPQHPATHGVLRVVLDLDGEKIVRATPVIGYMHRGFEKLAEAATTARSWPCPTATTGCRRSPTSGASRWPSRR